MKRCPKCGETKECDAFYKSKQTKDGLFGWCKGCHQKGNSLAASKKKEERLAYSRAYYKKNKERFRQYCKDNRKQINDGLNRRRASSILRRAKHCIQTRLRELLSNKGSPKKSQTLFVLGCSWDTLLTHLGPRPEGDIHLDHICPLAQATSTEEVERLFHYSNLRWLPAADNLAKSDNWTLEGHLLCWDLLGRDWID